MSDGLFFGMAGCGPGAVRYVFVVWVVRVGEAD